MVSPILAALIAAWMVGKSPGTFFTVWSHVGYPVGTGGGGGRGIVEVTVEDAVVDAEESRSGVELDGEEDANEFNDDGVEVVGVVDALVEVVGCIVVEVEAVLEADSDVDVVDVTTGGVDEVVEDDCVRSVGVEEDAALEVELDVVEEDVTSEDVEVVAPDEIVEVAVEDESAVWAEEKWTNDNPNTTAITSPPTIPARNECCFINLLLVY